MRHNINFWSLIFLMIAIFCFIAWVGQGICFSYSTERLTHNARHQAFRSILRQELQICGLSGPIIGACFTFITTLAAGIIMSLAIGWTLALVCTATIPILVGSGYLRLVVLALFDSKVRKTHEEAAIYASEGVTSIRSVASLTIEKHVLDESSSILAKHAAKSLKSILKASTLYAASQSFAFFCAALAFWYGGTLQRNNEYTLLQFYICFAAPISGSQIAGAIFSYAPDMSKALHAGRDLKALFELTPAIDTWCDGSEEATTQGTGRIDISDVSFRSPTRPERLALENIDIQIQPGQFVALVGASGSGKSTLIQLLERFYDPTNGRILVDGRDVAQINVNEYRRLVSLVSQEPTLYEGSIRENLLLGVERTVDGEELVRVCKEANIYDFISSLPEGFHTPVGTGGTMLSGGQKQRLAIARALLRKTQILLLDEATSALDSESEKVVQDALDRAARQRTTIAVAHRLSTIQHADLICVLDHGRVVERGTHAELMTRRGLYYDLVQLQGLGEVGTTASD
ncbi:P-loop containing nucleoside triphosphate hydrolase protein [Aspergillus ellipticus CBS 707.79]|uniref:P-loop containing nucleoside triphosphate hydrolase protein n=1 Tax=Aspergillus ellipticus CBS 707.79 TaxID=1448320 RepID=A0A319CXN7_9EURO|nr:P-loop containing nucleoside triphosphate hydrolase protein [Aspergillus ellipticus CBS 707.79]